MATCIVSGKLVDPSDTAVVGATVSFNISSPSLENGSTSLISPKALSTTTASDGTWSLTIAQKTSGVVTINCPPDSSNATVAYKFTISVPAASTANFSAIWTDSISF